MSMGAPLSSIVGFAIIPESPRMFPPVEAIVSAQADPPELAISPFERARRAAAAGGPGRGRDTY